VSDHGFGDIDVVVRDLDGALDSLNLADRRISLLKIDVEGLDLSVLRGFSNAISEGRVGFVQFEFTLWAAITNTQLKDFYDLLGPAGYSIGKIYPTYIDWRPYKPEQEIYVRANFAAVHKSRPDLIERLVSDH